MNNPPAFPQGVAAMPDGSMYTAFEKHPDFGGMSLRDYFAGEAMQAIITSGIARTIDMRIKKEIPNDVERAPVTDQAVAQASYNMADAMLAEREKPKAK